MEVDDIISYHDVVTAKKVAGFADGIHISVSRMADWSRLEVEAAVADYLDMLALELRGEPFNKAEHNRNLVRVLNGRTRGSIERKHQNISAVLIELGYP